MRDWDDEFAHAPYIPGSEKFPAFWSERAAVYRKSGARIETDIPYGPGARQKLDMIWPDGSSKGLVVFVHGGFWMRCSKFDWTDLAEGARAKGWAVAVPGYTLTPDARISDITKEIAAAIRKAASLVDGPVHLAGHSAGGHLVTRMICEDSPLPPDVRSRIVQVMSISGLHDLRPLRNTRMNATLNLDPTEAANESAALCLPASGAKLICWVGAGERPEFIRQSRLLAIMWDGPAQTRLVEEPGHDHFSILEGLKESDSPIVTALLADWVPGA